MGRPQHAASDGRSKVTAGRTVLLTACVLTAVAVIAALWRGDHGDFFYGLGSAEQVEQIVSRTRPWLVVLLMALAIVASPIPSGPIALIAGALYGTLEGGILVWTGAVMGAVIDFLLSRVLATGR